MFLISVFDPYITSLALLLTLHRPPSLLLCFLFQAGAEVGRKARQEHVAEGAPAQQAAEREGQQPGQRAVPGHALPPTGRRRELQDKNIILTFFLLLKDAVGDSGERSIVKSHFQVVKYQHFGLSHSWESTIFLQNCLLHL